MIQNLLILFYFTYVMQDRGESCARQWRLIPSPARLVKYLIFVTKIVLRAKQFTILRYIYRERIIFPSLCDGDRSARMT